MISSISLDIFGQFYLCLKNNLKKIYQNSNFYEKKISKTYDNNLNTRLLEKDYYLK